MELGDQSKKSDGDTQQEQAYLLFLSYNILLQHRLLASVINLFFQNPLHKEEERGEKKEIRKKCMLDLVLSAVSFFLTHWRKCDLDKKNNCDSQSVLVFTFLFLKFYFISLFQTGTSAWQDQINDERLAKEKLGLGCLNKSLKSFQIMRRSQCRSFFKNLDSPSIQ